MTETQLGYIDWEGGGSRPLAGLTQAQVAAIASDKFDGFSYNQVFWLSTPAISGITSGHIDYMTVSASAFRDWQVPSFSNDAVSSFSATQLNQMETDTLVAFSDDQVDNMNGDALSGLFDLDPDKYYVLVGTPSSPEFNIYAYIVTVMLMCGLIWTEMRKKQIV